MDDLDSLDRKKVVGAEQAIQRIGTNALPELVSRIRATESERYRVASKLRWVLFRRPPGEGVGAKRRQAVAAFRILGSTANSASCALEEMLTNSGAKPDADVLMAAAQALAALGPRGALPLSAALTNPNPQVRLAALNGTYDLGTLAGPARSNVLRALGDPIPEARALAVLCWSEINAEPHARIPPLVEALLDSDKGVRNAAYHEISRIGTNALPWLQFARAASLGTNPLVEQTIREVEVQKHVTPRQGGDELQ